MAITISVQDSAGERVHTMIYDALKVEYKSKIGTVVITDLRVASVPRDLPIVETMAAESIALTASSSGWTVSNADSESYTGHEAVFFLSLKQGQLLVHA